MKTESIKSLLCLFTLLERKQRHNNAGTRVTNKSNILLGVVFLLFCYWLPFTMYCWYSTKRVGSQVPCLYQLSNILLGVVSMLQYGENNSLLDSQYFSVSTSSCMLQGRDLYLLRCPQLYACFGSSLQLCNFMLHLCLIDLIKQDTIMLLISYIFGLWL